MKATLAISLAIIATHSPAVHGANLEVDTVLCMNNVYLKDLPYIIVVDVSNETEGFEPPESLESDMERWRDSVRMQRRFRNLFPHFDLVYDYLYEPVEAVIWNEPEGSTADRIESSDFAYAKEQIHEYQDTIIERVSLFPDQSKMLITDFSDRLETLADGSYSIQIILKDSRKHEGWVTPRQRFEVRSMSDQERGLLLEFSDLSASAEWLTSDEGWMFDGYKRDTLRWVLADYKTDMARRIPSEIMEALAPYVFLSNASGNGDETLDEFLLDHFPEHLNGLKLVLLYEKTARAGNADLADEYREQIERNYPAWAWRIAEVDSGEGLIARAAKLRGVVDADESTGQRTHSRESASIIGSDPAQDLGDQGSESDRGVGNRTRKIWPYAVVGVALALGGIYWLVRRR